MYPSGYGVHDICKSNAGYLELCVLLMLPLPLTLAISGATSRVFDYTLRAKLSGALQCQVGLRDDTDQLPMLSTTTRITVNTSETLHHMN